MKKQLFNPITFLRGLACIGVVWYHVQYPGISIPWFFSLNLAWLSFYGSIAVWTFFIISGYVIGMGFLKKRYPVTPSGLAGYIWKRFLKIAPLYYFIIVVNYFAYREYHLIDSGMLFKLLTFNGTSLVNTFGIGYLWYVSAQMQLYLLAPLIFLILWLVSRLRSEIRFLFVFLIPVAGLILRGIRYVALGADSASVYVALIYAPMYMNIDFFAFGFALNLFTSNTTVPTVKKTAPWTTIIAWLSLFVLIGFSTWINYMAEVDTQTYRYPFGVILPTLVMLLLGFFIVTVQKNPGQDEKTTMSFSLLPKLPFLLISFIGIVSYEVYLLQDLFIFKLNMTCRDGCTIGQFMYKLLTVLGLSVLVALVFRQLSHFSRGFLPLRQKRSV